MRDRDLASALSLQLLLQFNRLIEAAFVSVVVAVDASIIEFAGGLAANES